MYVYSSLVKDSIVGNVFAPIVRVVGLEDKPKSETILNFYSIMAKAKTLLLSCKNKKKKKYTHTFFLTWMRINHHFCIYLAMSLVKDMYLTLCLILRFH